jgi:hypothetical protein
MVIRARVGGGCYAAIAATRVCGIFYRGHACSPQCGPLLVESPAFGWVDMTFIKIGGRLALIRMAGWNLARPGHGRDAIPHRRNIVSGASR